MSSKRSHNDACSGRMSFIPRTACIFVAMKGNLVCGNGRPVFGRRRGRGSVMAFHVALNHRMEFPSDVIALERDRLNAVNVNWRYWIFASPRQTDADVCALALAWAIDHAPHYRDVHVFHARIARAPQRHLRAQIALNSIGQFLKKRASRAPATGTCDDKWSKRTQSHRLQNFLSHYHLARAVAVGLRCQRYSDGIANALL